MSISVTNTDAQLENSTILTEEDAATIEGLHTYDRDPNPPFAVAANSASVDNLIAQYAVGPYNGQFVFPASQNASANANTLDDYEEGTWTPVLTFTTPGDLSVVYSTQLGKYTKIGRQVTVNFFIVTSTFTHTTASGQALITGVPFAANDSYVGAIWFNNIVLANYTQFVARLGSYASSTIDIVACAQNQAATVVQTSHMPTAGSVTFNGTVTYFV